MSEIVKAPTPTAVTNALRVSEFAKLTDILAENGYEILPTKGAQFASPVTDSVGALRYIRVTLEVPKGERDGNAYDGKAESEIFKAEQAEKVAKAEEVAKRKAEKIAKAKKA